MSCFRWSMGEISSHGIECLPASSVARSVTHVPGLFCYPCPWTAPTKSLTHEFTRFLLFFPEDRLAEVVGEPLQVLVVLLADVLGELAGRVLVDVPPHRERLGVRTWIVERRLVGQRA